MLENNDIKEIVLNPAYCTEEDVEYYKRFGIPVRWMDKDELSDKEIYVLITEE